MSADTTEITIYPSLRITFDDRSEDYLIYVDEETRQRDLDLLAASVENEDTVCLNETHYLRCSRVVKWRIETYWPERAPGWYLRQAKDEAVSDER